MNKRKKISLFVVSGLLLLPLGGCTLNSDTLSTFHTTNSADTGKFKAVKVTYENGDVETFSDVEVFPYNNGGDDSTGGRLEVRKGKTVYVMPNNALVELRKKSSGLAD